MSVGDLFSVSDSHLSGIIVMIGRSGNVLVMWSDGVINWEWPGCLGDVICEANQVGKE